MLRYALFVRNVDYDKIYRTSLEVIEGRFNTKDNIKDNQIDNIVQDVIDLFKLKNFNFKDTLVKQLNNL